MKLCVLLPDYSATNVDYKNYDPPRHLAHLVPEHTVDTVFLHKLTTYKQLLDLSLAGYDCFINLCEGYLEWEVPSIEVIIFLEKLGLPFTGPSSVLYDPPKTLMKYVAHCERVATPKSELISRNDDLDNSLRRLMESVSFPHFVKPAKAGDSLGIDSDSIVFTGPNLKSKVSELLREYPSVLVEEFVVGREFTVLVRGMRKPGECYAYRPIEYRFANGFEFKTYAKKTSELHQDCNIPLEDGELSERLRDSARRIFRGFAGVGYARMDFRVTPEGAIYFLEVNFTCSVFYTNGFEGSADHILKNESGGHRDFLLAIVEEGIERHRRTVPTFVVKGNAISGYGIYSTRSLAKDEIVFRGEEKSQRIVTKKWVDENWNDREKLDFQRYAYPVGGDVFILWDEDPELWAPQNHSCDPSTKFQGLNLVATRTIRAGEEMTIDYSTMINGFAESFECKCASANCRGLIGGKSPATG